MTKSRALPITQNGFLEIWDQGSFYQRNSERSQYLKDHYAALTRSLQRYISWLYSRRSLALILVLRSKTVRGRWRFWVACPTFRCNRMLESRTPSNLSTLFQSKTRGTLADPQYAVTSWQIRVRMTWDEQRRCHESSELPTIRITK